MIRSGRRRTTPRAFLNLKALAQPTSLCISGYVDTPNSQTLVEVACPRSAEQAEKFDQLSRICLAVPIERAQGRKSADSLKGGFP